MRAARVTRALAALALGLGLAAGARAQLLAPSLPNLYQEALQSIAEGRKGDASEALTRVVEQEPLHAGAWLDLALIQCGLGHADKAETLFAAIETRFHPPLGILELIAEARAAGCDNWQPHSSAGLSLGRGLDDNVNQGASDAHYRGAVDLSLLPEFLPKHDQYSALSAQYVRDLSPNGAVGFAQFQARRNDRYRQYDSAALFAGVDVPWRLGRWSVNGSAMLSLTSLGGALYQRQAQLQARLGPPLALPAANQLALLAGVTRNDYPTLGSFNSSTYELRAQFSHRGAQRYASASLAALFDQSPARPGGSRHGWLAGFEARQRLAPDWTSELAYTRQGWDSQSAYAPSLIDQVRTQATHSARAALLYAVDKHQSWRLELRAVHNRENISIFQYNNRQLLLNWQWQGP